MSSLEKKVASIFMEMADGVETGQFGARPKIALTGMGSEHGEENSMAAAVLAAVDSAFFAPPHPARETVIIAITSTHTIFFFIVKYPP